MKTFLFFPIFSSNKPHVVKGPWGLPLSRTLSASVFGTVFFTESKGVILVLVQDLILQRDSPLFIVKCEQKLTMLKF